MHNSSQSQESVVTNESPTVCLRLESSPETLTLVRGMLGGVAELLQLDPELLDDLKTAVSEACNNVVMHAYEGDSGPLEVRLYAGGGRIEAVIVDEGSGIPEAADPDEGVHGVGLPLIKALTDDAVEFIDRPEGGTVVRMSFAGMRGGEPLFRVPAPVAQADAWADRLSGDAVVSLSPVPLLGPVLGRLARALAARARFSLDRFSDVYLVTDAIAAHAARTASNPRLGFAIATDPRRLEIVVGPLRDGSGATLKRDQQVREPGDALLLLSDTVRIDPVEGGELLQVVMTDEPERLAASS
jgi:anti-sigma regulatory factor (Ser/Thr protein kinase)